MPAEDGPNNQRKPENRAHEQKKQQPTESIYLKSENEKKGKNQVSKIKKTQKRKRLGKQTYRMKPKATTKHKIGRKRNS